MVPGQSGLYARGEREPVIVLVTDVSGCSSDSDGDEGLPVPPKAKAGKGGVGS